MSLIPVSRQINCTQWRKLNAYNTYKPSKVVKKDVLHEECQSFPVIQLGEGVDCHTLHYASAYVSVHRGIMVGSVMLSVDGQNGCCELSCYTKSRKIKNVLRNFRFSLISLSLVCATTLAM